LIFILSNKKSSMNTKKEAFYWIVYLLFMGIVVVLTIIFL
jgi:hypothetical protein